MRKAHPEMSKLKPSPLPCFLQPEAQFCSNPSLLTASLGSGQLPPPLTTAPTPLLPRQAHGSSSCATPTRTFLALVPAAALEHKHYVCPCNLCICTFTYACLKLLLNQDGTQPSTPNAVNSATVSQSYYVTLHHTLQWG